MKENLSLSLVGYGASENCSTVTFSNGQYLFCNFNIFIFFQLLRYTQDTEPHTMENVFRNYICNNQK